MQEGNKKQLVMIGIRRRGESGFKLKMIKREADRLKPGFDDQSGRKPSATVVYA